MSNPAGGSGGSAPRASTAFSQNGPAQDGPSQEFSLQWRSSRHARRLLTLGLAALFIATVARRPEFAGLAAPALLLLAAGRSQQRPPRVNLRARPSTRRAFEGETVAVDLQVDGQDGCSARWIWHAGREIEPVGATAVDGPAARFVFSPLRWGRREIGTVDLVLRDRWRLAEGHLTVNLPDLDCYPAPAQQRTAVVLSRRGTVRGDPRHQHAPPAAGRAAVWLAGRGVQPAAGPAVRRDPAGHARTRLHHAGGGRAQRRAAGPPAHTNPAGGGLGRSSPRANTDRMARRIWRMEQEAIRFSLRELGVPVVHWDGFSSLDLPLARYTRRPMLASGSRR